MGEAIGGIAQGAGSVMAAQAQGNALENQAKLGLQGTEEQIAEQKNEFGSQMTAYQAAQAQGQDQMGTANTAFENSVNTANPELATMSKDIATNNAQELQQGASQMGANLATQGVRGGQAATLLNRGTGQQAITAQQNINQMKFQDAATRQAQQAAYQVAIAQTGQAASLRPY